MKTIFYTVGLGFLLAACNGESTVSDPTTDSTKTNTIAAIQPNIDIDVEGMLAKYPVKTHLPFVQDSAYLETAGNRKNDLLEGDEIRFLSYNFVENDLSYSGKTTIDDALFFDSLILAQGYEAYLEVLDIGMMKSASGHAIQKLALDDSTDLLLWCITFSTYEACPYFSGRNLYASVFRNNQIKSCTLVGENSGSGDAPFWSETTTLFSAMNNGEMTAVKTDRNGGDTDEEGNELMSESTITYSLEIVDGMWQVTEQTQAAQ